MLKTGDKVPPFQVIDSDGNAVTEAIFHGRRTLLFFYPKANTPGCTLEAAGFRDELKAFDEAGVAIVGASADSPKANTRFKDKRGLPYPLLCDTEDKDLCRAFGVWQKKKLAGREYMGIVRTSFLIGADGTVEKVYSNVKTTSHAADVLCDV